MAVDILLHFSNWRYAAAAMCNHYRNIPGARALMSSWREYIAWSLHPFPDNEPADADIWPRRSAMVVCPGAGGGRIAVMQWGFPLAVPGKRPGRTVHKTVTNVRNLASPFWRPRLADPAARCLVPFTSFAEPDGLAGEAWFALRHAGAGAFAGIWGDGPAGPVFAFLTCPPNPLVAAAHPKAMPVILGTDAYARWLAGDPAADFAQPFPSQLMVRANQA